MVSFDPPRATVRPQTAELKGDRHDGPVPGGLAEGNPEHAEVLGYPAKGRLLEYVLANPESAEARLTRYLLLRFPVHVNLDGIATALSRNPNVQNVEEVVPLRFHVSAAPPTKAIPSDDLVGTGASLPQDAQWGLHLLNLPAAWDLSTGWGLVALLDVGLMVNHEDLKVFGTDEATGQLRLGPFREHLSDDLDWLGCGVDEKEEGDNTVGHGTHVSGIVAGRANNGRGIAGACWDCGISMIRLDQSNGGKIQTAFRHTLTYGAQILSMSFGLPEPPERDHGK